MGKLSKLIEKIQALPVQQIAEDSLREITPELVNAQKEQMQQGKDSEGGRIEWQRDSHYPYTKPYERRKQRLGLQTAVVDLRLTGSFQNRIEAKVEQGKVIMLSDDPKALYLEKNYGRDLIMGLNKEKKGIVIREFLRPVTFINLRKYLKLS